MSLKPYYEKDGVVIYNDNYENVLPKFSENTFDLVLTDPPYGITQCEWDIMPDLESLWKLLKSVGKDNCAYVFTAQQPFTSKLVLSNLLWFKYDWVWKKPKGTGHLNAKRQPMRDKEDILVFYRNQCVYNPQWTFSEPYSNLKSGKIAKTSKAEVSGKYMNGAEYSNGSDGRRYPKQVQEFGVVEQGTCHPTQKPVELMEYMIKTYTNEGDIILDPFLGSGTTLIAAKNLRRNAIGIEISEKYCEITARRLDEILKM